MATRTAPPVKQKEKNYIIVRPSKEPEPEFGPPADLFTLPDDLHYRRERAIALASAYQFERWLLEHIAERRIPMDDVMVPVMLTTAFVKYFLLARVEWPELFSEWDDDCNAPDPFWTPATEAEAIAVGLGIRRVRRNEKRPAPNLTGCAGHGGKCRQFRRFGERFCPECRKAELQRIREAA